MDYSVYHAKGKEKAGILLKGFLLSSVVAILFYKSIIAVVLFSPFSVLFLKWQEKKLCKARKWWFNQDFKQGIVALNAALNAGYSIENAFKEACKDLALLYDKEADIMIEFSNISKQISLNKNIEELLEDLAFRTGIEDIETFCEIFKTAKRTGGNLMKIISHTANNIGDRIEIQREMETLIAQKKLEANIMSVVPLGIVVYLWISSPGFMDVMYHNPFGWGVMSAVLVAYLIGYLWMQKIMNIEL